MNIHMHAITKRSRSEGRLRGLGSGTSPWRELYEALRSTVAPTGSPRRTPRQLGRRPGSGDHASARSDPRARLPMKGLDTPVLLQLLRGEPRIRTLLRELKGEELVTTE